jgi:hypothetical protein
VEVQMAVAQILKVKNGTRPLTRPYRPATNIALNTRPLGADKTNEAMQQMSNDTKLVKGDKVKVRFDTEEVECL